MDKPPNDERRPHKRKQALYFPAAMLEEMVIEATRQGRPLSWIAQEAWRRARATLRQFPAATQED